MEKTSSVAQESIKIIWCFGINPSFNFNEADLGNSVQYAKRYLRYVQAVHSANLGV